MTTTASRNNGLRGSKGKTVRHSRRRFLAALSSASAVGLAGSQACLRYGAAEDGGMGRQPLLRAGAVR